MGILTESKLLALNPELTLATVCGVISGVKEVYPDIICTESPSLNEFGTINDPMLQIIRKKEEL